MDIAALKTELQDPRYAGMTPAEIISDMKANTADATQYLVPLADIEALLRVTVIAGKSKSIWSDLRDSAATDTLANDAYDMLTSPRLVHLDRKLAFVQGFFSLLVSGGYADQATIDTINQMGKTTINRGELLFGEIPTVLQIQFAALS